MAMISRWGACWALCFFAAQFATAQDAQQQPHDPLERYNRAMFAFNDTVDRYALKPIAKGYQAVLPDPVEQGIGNVFFNLTELRNITNNLLQAKWGRAGTDTGRFLINTTLGIGGLFDVARQWGIQRHNEDFGQTLGHWGVGSGPYLVLPLLGPSTVRDGFARIPDTYADPVAYVDHVRTRNSTVGTRLVSDRAALLETEKLITGDRYVFVRDAYLQRREYLVKDGEVEDAFGEEDFGDFEDWDAEEDPALE